jgi:hypothetical protein
MLYAGRGVRATGESGVRELRKWELDRRHAGRAGACTLPLAALVQPPPLLPMLPPLAQLELSGEPDRPLPVPNRSVDPAASRARPGVLPFRSREGLGDPYCRFSPGWSLTRAPLECRTDPVHATHAPTATSCRTTHSLTHALRWLWVQAQAQRKGSISKSKRSLSSSTLPGYRPPPGGDTEGACCIVGRDLCLAVNFLPRSLERCFLPSARSLRPT